MNGASKAFEVQTVTSGRRAPTLSYQEGITGLRVKQAGLGVSSAKAVLVWGQLVYLG